MSPFDHLKDFLANSHEILPGSLWQTSWLGEFSDVPEGVRPYVISLVDTPERGDLAGFVRWPFDDAPILPDMSIAWAIARLGAVWLRKGPLIVHCLEGNNRSGLLCGMVLIALGDGGAEAVRRIHAANPDALYNDTFRQFLEGIAA